MTEPGSVDLNSGEVGPLAGFRVVEVAGSVAAGYAARLLADLGACVLLVNRPASTTSDPTRSFRQLTGPFAAGLHETLDCNKQWMTATRETEWETLRRWADVVLLDEPVDRMTAPADWQALTPHLVTVMFSHFGTTGSRAGWRGSDLVDEAYGGGCQANGEPARAPLRAPAYVGEHEVGVGGALAALLGVIAARRDGRGQNVEVSAVDSWATIQTAIGLLEFIFQGRLTTRAGKRFGARYPYETLPCADGDVRLICVVGREWKRALAMMGEPEWARNPRYADRQENQRTHADELDELVKAWLAGYTRSELTEMALEYAVPWAPVLKLAEITDQPQLRSRGFVWFDGEHHLPGFPAHFSRTPVTLRHAADDGPASTLPALEARAELPVGKSDQPPLTGLRVIDLSWAWAGGTVGSVLADFGADVIKIESMSHLDPMRMGNPLLGGDSGLEQSGLHHNVNRNKRSVAIDIKRPEGATLARKLAATSDLFLTNLSAGTLSARGLGYSVLSEDNPGLIYLSNTGVGQHGPLCEIRAYAPVITALSGVDSITGYPDEPALGLQHGIADPNAALHGVLAVLAALLERERSGLGQFIDLSQLESMVSLIGGHLVANQLDAGVDDAPVGNRDPLMAPHGIYPSAGDDRWIAIACTDDECWRLLRRTIGDPEWSRDSRFDSLPGRLAAQDELDRHLSECTGGLDRWMLAEQLQAAGVPAAPLLDTADRFSDEHLRARGAFVGVDHPVVGAEFVYGLPWKLSRTPGRVTTAAPLLGQHTREVLSELLALPSDEIDALVNEGVLV